MKIIRSLWAWLWRLPSSEVANVLVATGVVVSTLLLLATCILAFYSFKQWEAVDKTLQEIKTQTPSVLQSGKAAEESARTAATEAASSDASTQEVLRQMKIQSRADTTLANATRALASTAEEQYDMAQRPMLILADTKLPWIAVNKFANVSYDLELKVDNSGRSPATDTAVLSNLLVEDSSAHSFSPQGEATQTCHEADAVGHSVES